METKNGHDLDVYWEGLAERVQRLRQLDLSDDADLECALEESQRLLGALAHCRHLLRQVEGRRTRSRRRAA